MTTTETVKALRQASGGLSYTSETDAPWAVFHWPGAEGEPTADGVRRKGRHKAGAAVEERTIDEFFRPLVEDGDEAAAATQYRTLLQAVKDHLADPKVVRVGEIQVSVYVVGRAKEGGWAGLKTKAVET